MIGKLKGILDLIEEDRVILDVGGVGYIVNASTKSIVRLPRLGETTSLLIYCQVKEDDISLYGFIDLLEKEWFENLITVQGIGSRLALTILSSLDPVSLINTITQRNKDNFKAISGVGPKLAERIFTEISKKANQNYASMPVNEEISSESHSNVKDALIALTNLGYNRNEVQNVCKRICDNKPEISINDLIRSALKELASS